MARYCPKCQTKTRVAESKDQVERVVRVRMCPCCESVYYTKETFMNEAEKRDAKRFFDRIAANQKDLFED